MSPAAWAADLAPSWTALPDETALMLRLPGGEAFLDALRTQTKLGAVVLSHDRIERAAQMIRERSPEGWDDLRELLGRVDLKPADWRGLVRGDTGVAIVSEPRADRAPLIVALGWLEPGDDLAPRLLAALQSVLADQADEPLAAKRQDIELAGHDVLHITMPIVSLGPLGGHTLVPDGDASQEKLQEQIDQLKERIKQAKQIESDRVHVFVSRLGGRIVWASTAPQSGAEVRKKSDAEREALDWDALTGLDQATAVFGRFLSAHEGSPAAGVRRLLETAGLEESLPTGPALVEIVADPRPLLKLADAASNPKIKRVLDALGAKGLGPFALRISLDGAALRTGAFLSMPAPRGGLLALVDQPKLTPEPPPWAPSAALGFQELSFELGKAYGRIKDLVIEQSDGAARQTFDQVETAAKTFLQTDLNDLLASLAGQYSVVTFAPRIAAGADNAGGEVVSPAVVQRMGIVCQLNDEQIWRQFLKAASQFAQGGAGGGLRAVEEQGFSGYRIQQNDLEVGIFVGQGRLVVGIGPGVAESLLSVLRTPPEGAAALRASGLVERGRALIAPRPCLSYKLSDSGANVKVTRRAIQSLLEAPLKTGGSPPNSSALAASLPGFGSLPGEEKKELLEKIKSLLPSDEELDGALGVSVSQTVATDEGLMIQSALELPSP